ncbi:hypothetical protein Xph01_47840 [Micromonospora phaseoli]|nr:hypothetical protein Xph01_47840 [Micromonospora phaseoli]
MFVAVTWLPDEVTVAFQAWVTRWPDGNVQARFQPFIGSPRLVTFTLAVKPPGHWDGTAYVTRQPAAAWALAVTIVPATISAAIPPATTPTRQGVLRVCCELGLALGGLANEDMGPPASVTTRMRGGHTKASGRLSGRAHTKGEGYADAARASATSCKGSRLETFLISAQKVSGRDVIAIFDPRQCTPGAGAVQRRCRRLGVSGLSVPCGAVILAP